ncbi:hypothetical protein ACFU53_34845 [Streptomyces sp. NPDC057474]|uniref:hypothetical protein n=1 Tax=Streptomyces sp. NPDC057474 TaxID=3346144 RepID=UPI00369CF467
MPAWARKVEDGIETLTTTVTVTEPGEHVLRLFMVAPAIAVDQIAVDQIVVETADCLSPTSRRRRVTTAPSTPMPCRKRPWSCRTRRAGSGPDSDHRAAGRCLRHAGR